MTRNSDTFVKVTNKDIYDKLIDIERHVEKTNGSVRLAKWVATTALSIALIAVVAALKG
jgi:hypothetical protein